MGGWMRERCGTRFTRDRFRQHTNHDNKSCLLGARGRRDYLPGTIGSGNPNANLGVDPTAAGIDPRVSPALEFIYGGCLDLHDFGPKGNAKANPQIHPPSNHPLRSLIRLSCTLQVMMQNRERGSSSKRWLSSLTPIGPPPSAVLLIPDSRVVKRVRGGSKFRSSSTNLIPPLILSWNLLFLPKLVLRNS
jgi:hypothetical protein